MAEVDGDEVRRLRAEGGLSVAQIRERTGLGRNRVQELLRGVPPPELTRRPTAKDELRAEALKLRAQGGTVPDIADRLGVARSTAYLWVRHVPLEADPAVVRAPGASWWRCRDRGRCIGGWRGRCGEWPVEIPTGNGKV
ncbi:helix-turn-helix domain-containing protein [Micromonospora mirobrigensis]|uniref:Homeodomain-like domain-containing protein n=1 Tax=Micromonospora mirobrigensis TaxID=262898 RepID=A0A1C4UW82_9ACTN|nr:helix-turn-helix domain-containing protein [Micromonospora mirobrigensis]SCE75920.1 Homeodomain-like domain-containing protein [Micromonospora mirobrigensis]